MDKLKVDHQDISCIICTFFTAAAFVSALVVITLGFGYFAMVAICLTAVIFILTSYQEYEEERREKQIKCQQQELRTIFNGMQLTVGQILTNNDNPSVIADNYERLNAALQLFNTKLECHNKLVVDCKMAAEINKPVVV